LLGHVTVTTPLRITVKVTCHGGRKGIRCVNRIRQYGAKIIIIIKFCEVSSTMTQQSVRSSKKSNNTNSSTSLDYNSNFVANVLSKPDFPKEKWQSIFQEEEQDNILFQMRNELVSPAIDYLYEEHMKKEVVPFIVECFKEAWIQAIEWSELRKEGKEVEGTWKEDEEPLPSRPDNYSSICMSRDNVSSNDGESIDKEENMSNYSLPAPSQESIKNINLQKKYPENFDPQDILPSDPCMDSTSQVSLSTSAISCMSEYKSRSHMVQPLKDCFSDYSATNRLQAFQPPAPPPYRVLIHPKVLPSQTGGVSKMGKKVSEIQIHVGNPKPSIMVNRIEQNNPK